MIDLLSRAGGSVLARWLLLGQAVQRAEPPYEVDGMDTDHLAVGEQLGQRAQGNTVGGIVEGGREHGVVGDLEIHLLQPNASPKLTMLAGANCPRSILSVMESNSMCGRKYICFPK